MRANPVNLYPYSWTLFDPPVLLINTTVSQESPQLSRISSSSPMPKPRKIIEAQRKMTYAPFSLVGLMIQTEHLILQIPRPQRATLF